MRSFESSVSVSGSSVAGIQIESVSRSHGARRGPLSHPATLFFLAAAIFFAAYALGYIPQLGRLLEAAIRSGQSTAIPALNPAFYGIAGLVAFLLLLALLRSIDMLLSRFRKTSLLEDGVVKTLASGGRDRTTDLPATLAAETPSVQNYPAPDVRTQASRNPTSAQRKAIHSAALHAIESRSFRIAETSGLHRRNSDYEGPHRRSTDHPVKQPSYQGPYRRSTDQMTTPVGTSSSEPRIELDRANFNRLGPILVPPRNRCGEPGTVN